jgi:hypothetical protein
MYKSRFCKTSAGTYIGQKLRTWTTAIELIAAIQLVAPQITPGGALSAALRFKSTTSLSANEK